MRTWHEILYNETSSMFDEHEAGITGIENAMKLYAKEMSIAFMKWYGIKMMGFIEYIREVKPLVISREIEDGMQKFEGKSLEELFDQFIEETKNTKP